MITLKKTAALHVLLVSFTSLFDRRVWDHVVVLVCGTLLARGQRTVTSALRALGLHNVPFHRYHRVLSARRWSSWRVSRRLLELIVQRFVPEGPVVIGIDDTIERRRGKKIDAKGVYRDACRSAGHRAKTRGLRWVTTMVLAEVPFAKRVWGLPFLTLLAPSEKYHKRLNRRHVTTIDHAIRITKIVARWLSSRRIIVVCDGAFGCCRFLQKAHAHVAVITRLRLNARLFTQAPQRTPRTVGRPRTKGTRLPSLKHIARSPKTTWKQMRVPWYGATTKRLRYTTGDSLWCTSHGERCLIRWVLIAMPDNKLEVFASTDLSFSPKQILSIYIKRWSMDVTHREARTHMGVETQRQWCAAAIRRTTPTLFGLISFVTLIADSLNAITPISCLPTDWYHKPLPTFSDALRVSKGHIWKAIFVDTSKNTKLLKIPRRFALKITPLLAQTG